MFRRLAAMVYRNLHRFMVEQGGALSLSLIFVAVISSPFSIISVSLAWLSFGVAAFALFSSYIEILVQQEAEDEREKQKFEDFIQDQNRGLRRAGWSDKDIRLMEEARRSLNDDRRAN